MDSSPVSIDIARLLSLLTISDFPDDFYLKVCEHFDTMLRGCTHEQIKAYMRHELTNYDHLRKLYKIKGETYRQFKSEVTRLIEEAYEEWRSKRSNIND